MNRVLTDFSPSALAAAIEANFEEGYPLLVRQIPDVEIYEGPEMVRFLTGVPHSVLNGVLRARLSAAEADTRIVESRKRFESRGLPMTWWCGPSAQPPDLAARLDALELPRRFAMPGMAIDLAADPDSPLPPGTTLEEVEEARALARWRQPFEAGFQLPAPVVSAFVQAAAQIGFGAGSPARHFLATQNGAPVACASIILAAGVAGIYNVATVPEARRQGLAAAVVQDCLRTARGSGYRIGILHSSTMGYRVYERLGFREYCKIGVHLWMPPPDLSAPSQEDA